MPKTGTTSLQELCFARHPEVRYFGQTNIWNDTEAKTILRGLLLDGDESCRVDRIHDILSHALLDRAVVAISDEALTFGEFMVRASLWPVVTDHRVVAKRAKCLLGDAEILIVLRNQADFLESWQRQGLKTGKYTQTDYGLWVTHDLGEAAAARMFALLDYGALYEAWADAFGPDRIHVRPYERYQSCFEELAADFSGVLGIDSDMARTLTSGEARNITGAHYSGLPPRLQRFVRHAAVRATLKLLPGNTMGWFRQFMQRERSISSIDDRTKRSIRSDYAKSNRALFQHLGIDSNGLGYD